MNHRAAQSLKTFPQWAMSSFVCVRGCVVCINVGLSAGLLCYIGRSGIPKVENDFYCTNLELERLFT